MKKLVFSEGGFTLLRLNPLLLLESQQVLLLCRLELLCLLVLNLQRLPFCYLQIHC